MNNNIDDFINNYCNKECFFTKVKDSCISFFRSLPKQTSTLESIAFHKKIQAHCKPHSNRKKIYMFVLSKQIYSSCKNQKNNKEGCISYLFEKLLNESKKFDIDQNSTVFKTLKLKFKKLEELYRQTDDTNLLDITSSILLENKEIEDNLHYTKEETKGAINNYLKKIVKRYQTENFDKKSREALIDNALLHIEEEEVKNYFDHKVFNYRKEQKQKKNLVKPLRSIENELLLFLNKEEISYILSAVLYEFMHKEKFFSFINNRIPLRIIDFYRKNSTLSNESISIEDNEENNFNEDDIEEILDIYRNKIKLCSQAEQIILFLKFGTSLTDKIEAFLHSFTNHDIYIIRLYIREAGEITDEINKKIKTLQRILFNEMIDKKGETMKGIREDNIVLTVEIIEKIYLATPLSYKEISLIFGQQAKWASKKKELLVKRLEGIKNDRF